METNNFLVKTKPIYFINFPLKNEMIQIYFLQSKSIRKVKRSTKGSTYNDADITM